MACPLLVTPPRASTLKTHSGATTPHSCIYRWKAIASEKPLVVCGSFMRLCIIEVLTGVAARHLAGIVESYASLTFLQLSGCSLADEVCVLS